MIKKTSGQTALILILLTAAALIFFAITLNWGHVAQVKSLLTIAADESASSLASDAASYGEQQKQTYLGDTNFTSGLTGVLLDLILVIVAIGVLILTILFPPAAGAAWALGFAIAGVVASSATLTLQLTVINPTITSLWNKAEKNWPIQQQFYEGGISTALGGVVTDQVKITDYFDQNANGAFGWANPATPNDTIGRFAFFYSDRVKMLNQKDISQVAFFYNQLGEFMNGETCAQNAIDHCLVPGLPINSVCTNAGLNCTVNSYCEETSSDPACQMKIPNGFQLNDACADSNTASSTYNPYCDPCCQPVNVPNPLYCANNSTTTTTNTNGSTSTTCTGTTSTGAACVCNPLQPQYLSSRPSTCDQSASPAQCLKNNPYGSTTANPYTLLYDSTYQEYANNVSFLDQFGRDQQMGPFTTSLTPQGNFPNGIYPFFWLMKDYSPQVDNIVSTNVQPSQSHWCTAAVAPGYTAPTTGFSDLQQLTLSYACSGEDCCVNYLANNVVIDGVGTAFAANSASNPALDPSFADTNAGSWLEGDNQFCSNTLPYNGATSGVPDGTCEWTGSSTAPTSTTVPPNVNNSDITSGITVDSLDDTVHTLSDFVNFSNNFLSQNVSTLSSSFDAWYSQAAQWIAPVCDSSNPSPACNSSECYNSDGSYSSCPSPTGGTCSDGSSCGASPGRLLSIYDPVGYPNVAGIPSNTTAVDKLKDWNTAITNWLNNTYTSSSTGAIPWCVPPTTTGSVNEDNAITSNGTAAWGSLPSVINCLNYNANTPINNYQACLNALPQGACPSQLPAACAPSVLGRTLVSSAVEPVPAYDGCTGRYAQWVKDSLALATNEAPKFALRSAFLTDVHTRAQSMQNIFNQGEQALQKFFLPCSGTNCADGGPAAQLIYARTQPATTVTLPNAVIYGWVDKLPNGQTGSAHIVKVTAYSPGRGGNYSITGIGSSPGLFIWAQLPWIKTSVHAFTRDYELRSRDGYAYVSVKRWDSDHNPITFPNKRLLWQFLFHNPTGSTTTATALPSQCLGLSSGIGYGLQASTVNGLLNYPGSGGGLGNSSNDQWALSNAFMLNDNGNGNVDSDNLKPGSSCSQGSGNSNYCSCLSQVNQLLDNAPESHACAQYIASTNASGPSGNGDHDYSLKFVDCGSVPGIPNSLSSLDDLSYEGQ